ncbi:MAG: hypothetical protein LCH52_15065 [Bacteroidetes bacterium]|nr:hypothetical protein [Bacteroidota bacterium]
MVPRILRTYENYNIGKGETIVSIVLPTSDTPVVASFSNTIIKMNKDGKDISPGVGYMFEEKGRIIHNYPRSGVTCS